MCWPPGQGYGCAPPSNPLPPFDSLETLQARKVVERSRYGEVPEAELLDACNVLSAPPSAPPPRFNPLQSVQRTAEEISRMRHEELTCQFSHAVSKCPPDLYRRMEEWEKIEAAHQIMRASHRDRERRLTMSEADQARLDERELRDKKRHEDALAKYERRQALMPSALFSRLKARAARVSWDSWG